MRFLSSLLSILFCFAAYSAPRMTTEEEDKTVVMPLTNVDMQVDFYGRLAHVKTTMTFENPLHRTVGGKLMMPLPEGAEVIGYGLMINEKMVDGVAVEQSRARKAFEEIVARGVDPGLVEKMRGNIFSTRVFPFRGQESRTMLLRYAFDFTDKPELLIPFDFADKTSVRATVRIIEKSCTASASVVGKELNFLQDAATVSGTGPT